MSGEISILAIVPVAPGKLKRFKEFMSETLDYINKNEPGCLEFRMFTEFNAENPRCVFVERYASEDAHNQHINSPNFQKVMSTMSEEGLVSGAPEVVQGKLLVNGFQRS